MNLDLEMADLERLYLRLRIGQVQRFRCVTSVITWMVVISTMLTVWGCANTEQIARRPIPIQKLVPYRGSPVYGTIVSQTNSTITIAIADSRDTLVIDKSTVHESIDIQPRSEMVLTQLSWNPSIFYYREIVEPLNLGVSAQYLWKGLWMGDIRAVELGAEMRVLPFGSDLRGFFLAAYLNYATLVADQHKQSFSRWWANGFLVGWQWFPMYRVAAGIGMGVELWHFPQPEPAGSDLAYTGMPIARLQIGYAW